MDRHEPRVEKCNKHAHAHTHTRVIQLISYIINIIAFPLQCISHNKTLTVAQVGGPGEGVKLLKMSDVLTTQTKDLSTVGGRVPMFPAFTGGNPELFTNCTTRLSGHKGTSAAGVFI